MNKRNKGKKVLLLGLAAMLTLVTACGKDTGASGGADGDQITINMMHPWTSPNVDNEVYKARIAEFEKQHPNIVIKQDGVPAAQYKTKLRTLAAGNNLPDINVVWPGADLDPLVAGDLLQPINELMDNWSSILPEGALEGFNVDGQQYAIPTKQNFVDIIYYNKEMFAQVGYDEFPDTYDKFIDAVTKLKEAGITPISLGNKEQWPLQSSYISIIGDRFTGSDFLTNVLEKKAKFTDPEFVKALAVIEELTQLGAFNTDANNMDSVQAQDYFIQGKAAMHISSATVDGRVRINNEEGDKFGIALFPSVEGGKGDPAKSAGVVQYGIAMKSGLDEKKREAAEEFLKFFVNEDLYKELIRNGVVVPAKVEVPEDASKYLKEMLELTDGGTAPVFDSVIPTQVVDVLQNGLQALTIGHGTPEDIAEEVQKAFDDMN
ncbi:MULTISPECIES: extracellular solute-binding protein [Paenibacillus]|uniref:ABC transporter substrate-binding protein n=1 Tax=Paenibacillus campinasensis TaxID=66347 RepID=A0A268F1N5_9BACL|nr:MULTISPECIES: extracellular solute-binding protein [Paenibacillus]MUG65676.1 extracellular solute-binding protein [Paenibacillus campinasensis]PAD79287.1 ABC transporter substrate-binding protein [Paenibacillus campinasensis]PAK54280.1 ABC transporter substrate-binding protein [Paenibacillus sp. 7541]